MSGAADDDLDARLDARAEAEGAGGRQPPRFKTQGDALLIRDGGKDGTGDAWRYLAPRLDVLGVSRDADGENFGRLLTFTDTDGRAREVAVAMADVVGDGGELVRHLARLGYVPPAAPHAQRALREYVGGCQAGKRFRCVGRVGWCGPAFVLPDRTIGEADGERVLFQPEGIGFTHAYRAAGTLEDWQDGVARLAVGNTRLALSLSLALAGPLLAVLGEEGGGVHLRGQSSAGKSTALRACASVWGGGGAGYMRTWRATDNGLEAIAATHTDTVLCLDELGQADGRAAGAAAYMLANGQGKARAARSGGARAAQTWRVLFLSTGEVGLADKIMEDGRRGARAMAGQAVRVLDVPADPGAGHGLFDVLHGEAGGADLSRRLTEASASTYGTAGPAFVARLATEDHDALRTEYHQARAHFVAEVLAGLTEPDGQAERAAGRFALIAAAGELGVQWGVLPWPKGEAIAAARACFGDWLEARGGGGAAEAWEAVARVVAFVTEQGARFAPWGDDHDPLGVPTPPRLAGYRRTCPGEAAGWYVLPSVMKGEVLAGLDAKGAADALAAAGHFAWTTDGQKRRAGAQHRVPAAGGRRRLWHIRETITEGEA